jgi:hypothetical protein
MEKGGRRVNMKIMQMQVNAKMIPVETTPGTDGGGEGEYLRS